MTRPALLLLLLAGCVSRGVVAVQTPVTSASASGVVALRVAPCVDRTHTAGRDLGAEATASFRQALAASGVFRLDAGAADVLTCDVTSFLPGNAAKRLLFPGWGDAAAQVSAMVSDAQSGATVLIVAGNATLTLGGTLAPFTVGADRYILDTAVKEAVRKMVAWADHPETARP